MVLNIVGGESIIAPIIGTFTATKALVRANQGTNSPESGWIHEQRYILRLTSSLCYSAETEATPAVSSLAYFSSYNIYVFHSLIVESLMKLFAGLHTKN